MIVTRCASSHLMTSLLIWRNPQGTEANWIHDEYPFQHRLQVDNAWEHLEKVICSEIGITLLTITSTIETVAYGALTLVSLALHPLSDRPYRFFAKMLDSSSFTIIWGLANIIIFNPILPNMPTHESFARFFIVQCNNTLGIQWPPLFRVDDRGYVEDVLLHNDQPALDGNQQTIDQGANLLQRDVLATASDETLEAFMDMDPSIFMFALTKAAYIYTFGLKKKDPIPSFFTSVDQKLILELRQETLDTEASNEIEKLLLNLSAFETLNAGQSCQTVYNRLRGIAANELQNTGPNSLISVCWPQAIKQMKAS